MQRSMSVLVATSVLIGLGAGVASAATPASTVTTAGPLTGLAKTSLSIPLYNNSSDNMVLQSISGDNAGVPAVGSALVSGNGDQDFEVVFRAAKTTTVTAQYGMQDDTGATVGTATVGFAVDALGARAVSGSFKTTDGASMPFKTDYVGNGAWEVENASSTTNTIHATDPQANVLVQQYCNNANNSAVCTFTPAAQIPTTAPRLLASGYTQTGGDNEPSTVSVSAGYDDQTSTNTGASVTATMKLGGVLSLGVSQAYNQTLAFDKTFTAGESIPVNPGFTGYIWGQVPVVQYTGTMKIVVGNTTWNIDDYIVTSPDASRPLTSFTTGTYQGYYPIGEPDQAPASAHTAP